MILIEKRESIVDGYVTNSYPIPNKLAKRQKFNPNIMHSKLTFLS